MFIGEMQARGSIWRCLRRPEVTGNELRVAGNWWRVKKTRIMEIYYTEHALQRMAKRAIEPEWIERVIRAPALRLDDDNDPELEHHLAKVPELANRVLRVIVSKSEPRRVVTLYPDRNMKGKL
jgi:hypothetical protein